MAQTYFKTLSIIEDLINSSDHKEVIKETRDIMKFVLSVIRNGDYTNSQAEKFIASHFECGATQLTKLWNESHINNTKSVNTFRCQISTFGNYVASIFGYSSEELSQAVRLNNMEVLERVKSIAENLNVSGVASSEDYKFIRNFLPAEFSGQTYELSDCQKELQFLRTFDDRVIRKYLSSLDTDKLAFLIKLSDQPLISNEYRELGSSKSKVKVAVLNEQKLNLFNTLGSIKPIKVDPKVKVKEKKVGIYTVVEDEIAPEVEKNQTFSGVVNKYNLPVDDDFIAEIDKVLSAYKRYSQHHKENNIPDKYALNSNEEASKKVELFLSKLPFDGAKEELWKLNPFTLGIALNVFN